MDFGRTALGPESIILRERCEPGLALARHDDTRGEETRPRALPR